MRDVLPYMIHLTYLITITTCNILNTINLNGNTSDPDISIIQGDGTTIDSNGSWHINVIEQNGSDLAILMNENWKFDSHKPSQISIQIDGITPIPETNTDTDFIILFSTIYDMNRHQFFSATFHLDEARYAYKIYPNTNSTLPISNINEIIYVSSPDRWQRYSQNNQWFNAIPEYKLAAKWPLYFTITNYPKLNKILYQWRDGINTNNIINVEYLTSFTTQKGLDIYIAGDSPNEQLIITNINIELVIINELNNNVNINTIPTQYMPTETLTNTFPTDYYSYTLNTTNMNNEIWVNQTKITFDTHENINKLHIIYAVTALLFIIFIIAMYMICIVVKSNYKNNNKLNGRDTNYMKSQSNSVENINITKYIQNKRRQSYDIYDKNKKNDKRAYTLTENIIKVDGSDIDTIIDTNDSQTDTENDRDNNNIHQINENVQNNDNNSSEYIAHTIISGNATIGSRSNDEYDLDSMLLSQPTNNNKSEWSKSCKLKCDTSYEHETQSSIDKCNLNLDETNTLVSTEFIFKC